VDGVFTSWHIKISNVVAWRLLLLAWAVRTLLIDCFRRIRNFDIFFSHWLFLARRPIWVLMVSLLVTLRNTLVGFGPGLFLGYGLVTPGGCPAFRTALAYRENRVLYRPRNVYS